MPLQDQRRFLVSLRGGESTGSPRQDSTRQVCLELSGLTCGSCVTKAESALLAIDGVLEVSHPAPVCVMVIWDRAGLERKRLYDRSHIELFVRLLREKQPFW